MRKALRAHRGVRHGDRRDAPGDDRVDGDRFERRTRDRGARPPQTRLDSRLAKIRDLRYGENPHQQAAWYGPRVRPAHGGRRPWAAPPILQGKELSYTNLLDLDAAARIVLEFDEPAAVVIKHTNPCGAATGESAADAYVRARDADSLAAFGGIVALNRPIDVAAAEAIVSTFIEAVIAPAVEDAARVGARRGRRTCAWSSPTSPRSRAPAGSDSIARAAVDSRRRARPGARSRRRGAAAVDGGALPEGLRVVTRREPTAEEWEALRFAWRICAHVKSNTVIFTDAQRTLAIGAGQMSRVDAVNVAVMKAGARRPVADGIGRRVGRVLSVPRRPRRRRRGRRDRRRSAGRIGARRRSDRRGRRARPGDGVHRATTFQALSRGLA